MADAIGIGPAKAAGKMGTASGPQRTAGAGKRAASFEKVLNRSLKGKSIAAQPRAAIRQAAARPVSVNPAQASRVPTSPEEANAALAQAMAIENVPASWKPGLQFLMEKESRGQIDARNPVHSARGLFQLTRANYHLNPNGERSFGNGVEEAQGGIRYIRQRYGSVERAVAHWQKHHWY